jgi:predicted MFS family arabinose efflux permease
MFVFLGAGGVLGSLAAPPLARRFSMRTIVLATPTAIAVLVPLLILVPGEIAPGAVYGAMFFLFPTWNATVAAQRLRLTPDELRGRVSSIATLLSLGPLPLAYLGAGFLLDAAGSTPTVLALFAVMAVVAAAAVRTRAVYSA